MNTSRIPKGRLFNKLKGNEHLIQNMSLILILNADEENLLDRWFISKTSLGFSIFFFLKTFQRENSPPKITVRNTETLSKSRVSVTKEVIRSFFAE